MLFIQRLRIFKGEELAKDSRETAVAEYSALSFPRRRAARDN
jgi:hypothetical protein